jgi:predicted nucleic acid-binding protein
MINIFLDSDVLLDIVLQRKPHFQDSADVFALCDYNNYQGFTSVHSLLNVHYVAKKVHGEQMTRIALQKILARINVITESGTFIHEALKSTFKDFEDAVQYFAALSANADYIITRNIRDYQNSAIPVLTAEIFLSTL